MFKHPLSKDVVRTLDRNEDLVKALDKNNVFVNVDQVLHIELENKKVVEVGEALYLDAGIYFDGSIVTKVISNLL